MTYAPGDVVTDVAQLQAHRYRAMSPSEKLSLADAIWDLAWDATKAGVRMRRPELDEAAVEMAARAVLRRATD